MFTFGAAVVGEALPGGYLNDWLEGVVLIPSFGRAAWARVHSYIHISITPSSPFMRTLYHPDIASDSARVQTPYKRIM